MNLGFSEMLFIFLIALIIFGPKKLPEIGRQIGRFMGEFRRASNEFKYQLENEMRQLELEEAAKKITAPPPDPPVGSIAKELPELAASEPAAAAEVSADPVQASTEPLLAEPSPAEASPAEQAPLSSPEPAKAADA